MHPMHTVLWNFRCAKLLLPAAVLHKPGLAVLRDLCAHYSWSESVLSRTVKEPSRSFSVRKRALSSTKEPTSVFNLLRCMLNGHLNMISRCKLETLVHKDHNRRAV